MAERALPLVSVTRSRDGVWTVNERGPSRVAVAYFPSRWSAMRYAVRVARAKRRCRVALLERDGAARVVHEYDNRDGAEVEIP
jgi:hypothetical protein